MASKLVFTEDKSQMRGWDSAAVKRDDTSDERVVRELVQNALDAALDGNPIEVGFHLAEFSVNDIPHIREYKEAYDQAKETLKPHPSVTGKQITDRIDEVLKAPIANCLVCVDNAKGLTGPAVKRLYSEGVTDKPTVGRGSVGLGHLTAFAASDLRYVLYAGRNQENGAPINVFGGHAILATQDTRKATQASDSESGAQYSPDGFICDAKFADGYASDWEGASEVPDLLDQYLPEDGTGSVVVLCGYSSIKNPPKDLDYADLLLGAIAKNFMVAIAQENLTISFASPDSGQKRCDDTNLEEALSLLRFQRNRTRSIAGPPGAIAYELWETLKHGTHIEDLGGELGSTQVWLRNLERGEKRTRIALFREGMWITDDCPYLTSGHFGNNAPFSAVINLSSNSGEESLTQLVRGAEGTSHLEVNPESITDKSRRGKLESLLQSLQQKLSEMAPTQDVERFVPDEFRLFDIPAESQAIRPVPRARAKPAAIEGTESNDDVLVEEDTDDDDPGEGKADTKITKKRKLKDRKERPAKGNSAGIRSTARSRDNRSVHIGWSADAEGRGFPYDAAGIRIIIPGGSDETSRSAVRPDYLKLLQVQINGDIIQVKKDSPTEILVENPPVVGEAVVLLSGDIPDHDMQNMSVEIVHRKVPEKQ